jgi:hypothetical protein
VVTPRAHRDEPGVGRKRFEYPHGALPYGRRPPARGEAGVSLLAETPVVPAPYSGETDGVLNARPGSAKVLVAAYEANLATRTKNATTAPMRATDQTSSSSRV